MASGTVIKIVENTVNLSVTVNIGDALYVAIVDKLIFDALPTTLAKQNFIIALVGDNRRVSRQYENIYSSFIGTVLTIPD